MFVMRRAMHGVALGLAGIAVSAAAWAVATDEPEFWDRWSALRFRARASLLTGSVELRTQPDGKGTIRLETTASASFLGARVAQSRTTSWLDERTGLPRRHESVSDKRARRFVFGESGYTVERLTTKKHATEPIENWDVTEQHEFPYPAGQDGAVDRVFDYYGMLLHLAHLDLSDVGDESIVPVATSRGPVSYRVRVVETVDEDMTVQDRRTGKKRELPVRQLRLRIVPTDPTKADEGFLRMEGETEVWVEARTKTLLHVSGKVPKVPGRVKIVLAEIG
jgi:hypothetical protein